MGNFSFLLTVLCVVSLVSGQNLFHCSHNSTRGGVCVLESDVCCQSYKGSECKKELSQDHEVFAPRLFFSPDSLLIDYRPGLPSLICIERLRVPRGVAVRGKDIRGIHFEVSVWNSKSGEEIVFSSGTTIFPGNVSRTPLKNGIFCLEVELSEEELARESNTLTFVMAPLSASSLNPEPVVYSSEPSKNKLISVCDVTNVDINITDCLTWNKRVFPQKSCKREDGETEAATPSVARPETMRPLREIVKPHVSDVIEKPDAPYSRSEKDNESFWKLWAGISTTIAVFSSVLLLCIVICAALVLKKIDRHYKEKSCTAADATNHVHLDRRKSQNCDTTTDLESQSSQTGGVKPSNLSNSEAQRSTSSIRSSEALNDPVLFENFENKDGDINIEVSKIKYERNPLSKPVIRKENGANRGKDVAITASTEAVQSGSSVSSKASHC